jgi:hypothetical protein
VVGKLQLLPTKLKLSRYKQEENWQQKLKHPEKKYPSPTLGATNPTLYDLE